MGHERRIIPVASGKGGVGKTTLALNYALSLSLHGRTVLVDLDTGTSSVRSAIDVRVDKDLYHFFRKGARLDECVTTLDDRLDPKGRFRRFGFVASPRHLIEDIANFTAARREQLIDALNALDARFVVLDLKAGLDASVIDFLPYNNSGMLVFTPHLPAATLAAADIVKAVLFRKLRLIFAPGSAVYEGMPGVTPQLVTAMIDQAEDVYESGLHNLDAFVADLAHALGDHPVVRRVAAAVDTFGVYYVLNRFDGVRSSYDGAVRPFVESLAENVSARLPVYNLGWVVESEEVNAAHVRRVPPLLAAPAAARPGREDRVQSELARLAALHLPPRAPRARPRPFAPDPGPYLDTQLRMLRRMYEDMEGAGYRENFAYITSRSLHVMTSRSTADFGDRRLFKAAEMQQALQARGR
jgi:MinD-like ATPase involved in chromosome partitioning or flagellar assembly